MSFQAFQDSGSLDCNNMFPDHFQNFEYTICLDIVNKIYELFKNLSHSMWENFDIIV